MDVQRAPWQDFLLVAAEVFVIANIIFLDLWIFKNIQEKPTPEATTTNQKIITPQEIAATSPPATPSSQVIVQKEPIVTTPLQIPSVQPVVKEYFIPFGSGTGSFGDWQNIPGTLATIDNASYPNIKSVRLEASVHNLASDQIIYLRIFDTTDNHAVYNSDIVFSDKSEQFGTSASFALDGGAKQYQVQLKTQLQSPVSIDMTRIHIVLN